MNSLTFIRHFPIKDEELGAAVTYITYRYYCSSSILQWKEMETWRISQRLNFRSSCEKIFTVLQSNPKNFSNPGRKYSFLGCHEQHPLVIILLKSRGLSIIVSSKFLYTFNFFYPNVMESILRSYKNTQKSTQLISCNCMLLLFLDYPAVSFFHIQKAKKRPAFPIHRKFTWPHLYHRENKGNTEF